MKAWFDCRDLDGTVWSLGDDGYDFIVRQHRWCMIRVGGVASGERAPLAIRERVFRIPRDARDAGMAAEGDEFTKGIKIVCGRECDATEGDSEDNIGVVPVSFNAYICGTGDMFFGFRGGRVGGFSPVREFRLARGESAIVEKLLGDLIALMDGMKGDFWSFRRRSDFTKPLTSDSTSDSVFIVETA